MGPDSKGPQKTIPEELAGQIFPKGLLRILNIIFLRGPIAFLKGSFNLSKSKKLQKGVAELEGS